MSFREQGEEGPVLATERLLLRRWRAADAEPFARLNADPLVMEHFPATLSQAESDELIERMERSFREHGFGAWAVEVLGSVALAGFVGLWPQNSELLPFAPAIEIGWRLGRDCWGQGIATEAATAALEFGFGELGLDEVVSFTTVANNRSRAVMERLGMQRDPAEDFLHPGIAPGDRLAPHVLYRLRAGERRTGEAPRAAPRPRD
jgi:RimJ/RimL family protein N-acetyltransferase